MKFNFNKKQLFVILILFFLLFGIYFSIGLSFSKTEVFKNFNKLFDSDVPRVVNDLTVFGADHHHTDRHPLFVLFFNSLGVLLTKFLNKGIVAVLLNSLFGSATIILFYLFLKKINLGETFALIFSFFLSITWAHLIFSSIPDTFIFSAFSLILLLDIYLYLKSDSLFLGIFIIASIFSFGIAATNLVFSFILLFFRFRKKKFLKQIKFWFIFILVFLLISISLATIQKKIYPSTVEFFKVEDVLKDSGTFFRWDFFDSPFKSLSNTLPNFFIYNVVAPGVKECDGSCFIQLSEISPLKWVLISFFLMFVLFSFYLLLKNKIYKKELVIILALYFLWNFLFHLFYGKPWALILFSAHYTFPLMGVLAVPFNEEILKNMNKKLKIALMTFLIILILFIVLNNLLLIKTLFYKYL